VKIFKSKQEKLDHSLIKAVRDGMSLSTIQHLIDSGADITVTTDAGKTLLDLTEHEEKITFFLNNGLAFSLPLQLDKALYYCIGNAETISKLITLGADINYASHNWNPAVFFALEPRNEDSLKLLLAHQAKVNVQKIEDSNTPLHIAIAHENVTAVRLLLEHDARSDIKNAESETAVFLAQSLHKKTGKFCYQEMLTAFNVETAPTRTQTIFDANEISFIHVKPALGQHITETFNFTSGVYREVVYSMITSTQSSSILPFDMLQSTKLLANAEAEFIRQGGVPEYSFRKQLDKN
jgi:hypothetical protein